MGDDSCSTGRGFEFVYLETFPHWFAVKIVLYCLCKRTENKRQKGNNLPTLLLKTSSYDSHYSHIVYVTGIILHTEYPNRMTLSYMPYQSKVQSQLLILFQIWSRCRKEWPLGSTSVRLTPASGCSCTARSRSSPTIRWFSAIICSEEWMTNTKH